VAEDDTNSAEGAGLRGQLGRAQPGGGGRSIWFMQDTEEVVIAVFKEERSFHKKFFLTGLTGLTR